MWGQGVDSASGVHKELCCCLCPRWQCLIHRTFFIHLVFPTQYYEMYSIPLGTWHISQTESNSWNSLWVWASVLSADSCQLCYLLHFKALRMLFSRENSPMFNEFIFLLKHFPQSLQSYHFSPVGSLLCRMRAELCLRTFHNQYTQMASLQYELPKAKWG